MPCNHPEHQHHHAVLFGPFGPVSDGGLFGPVVQGNITPEELLLQLFGLLGQEVQPEQTSHAEEVRLRAGRQSKSAPTVQKLTPEVIWQDHTGKRQRVQDMETSHLVNALKYHLTQNKVPHVALLEELQKREMLRHLGGEILPRKGYKSPEEIREQFANKKQQRVGTQSSSSPLR